MATNLPTFYIDSGLITARSAEVTTADWSGGMNRGASNAPAIGVNTGNYDPKASDWSRDVPAPTAVLDSNFIGQTASGVLALDPATAGDNELVAFLQATGDVAADGIVGTVAGFDMRNRTGVTVPTGSWVWGVADQP